jgi:Asp-tRNA(Asn)/Glu-tRNA(Gln) amidotransferase A subunit family amidase
VVTALRQAGAVILGKTVTTELAALNPSATRNPHDATRTPGGSSSGSAAAVATGMVPVALGTQTAGSVIRPASFCGVCGMKPTHGLISRAGMMLQSHTLDTIGVLARDLDDIALILDSVSAQDPRDAASYPRSRGLILPMVRSAGTVPPTLAFWRTPAWDQGEPAMREALEALAAELGDRVETIDLAGPLNRVVAYQATIQAAENAAYYGDFYDRRPDGLSDKLRGRLAAAMGVSARVYLEALNARPELIAALDQVFARYDAILSPAAPGPAPRDLGTTGNPIFNGLWTYLGLPAVTLPLLEVDGMPVGVQLVGAARNDGRLLRTARWLVARLSDGT